MSETTTNSLRYRRARCTSDQSTWWKHWILAACGVLCFFTTAANGEDFGQAFSHTQKASTNVGDETYITISFSAFLAFCILSVVATIGYFSILEDRLMKRYLEEGMLVEAVVKSADFARGGNAGQWESRFASTKQNRMETEYVLFVEYDRPIAEGSYMTRIRKQIKAKEADINRPSHYTYSVDGHEESVHLDSPIQVQKMLQLLHDGDNVMNEGLGTIEMLVMPDFHKSGVSRRQVELANAPTARLSLIALIISGVGLALFCVRLAAKAISESQISDKTEDTNLVTFYMIGIFLVLLVLEILLVHCCMKKMFVEALEEEYLKGGDLVVPTEGDQDDSSLSTGSDFFLHVGRLPPDYKPDVVQEVQITSSLLPPHGDAVTSTCPMPSNVDP